LCALQIFQYKIYLCIYSFIIAQFIHTLSHSQQRRIASVGKSRVTARKHDHTEQI